MSIEVRWLANNPVYPVILINDLDMNTRIYVTREEAREVRDALIELLNDGDEDKATAKECGK